jgi:hypothetical protein
LENKRAEQVLPGSWDGGGLWSKQCIHMNKCKNNRIKKIILKDSMSISILSIYHHKNVFSLE